MLNDLFEKFLKEKIYLDNSSPNTITFYQSAWKISAKFLPTTSTEPDEDKLKDFIISLRQLGQKPVSVNAYIRSINGFLSWLHKEGHTSKHLKIKKLKVEQNI